MISQEKLREKLKAVTDTQLIMIGVANLQNSYYPIYNIQAVKEEIERRTGTAILLEQLREQDKND